MGRGLNCLACARTAQSSVEISLSPLETEDGILISSDIRDITERKLAEEARQLESQVD
jgi:protein-histidine pros-kinase